MKQSALWIALLASAAAPVSAAEPYPNFQGLSASHPQPVWFRASLNSWGKTPLFASRTSPTEGVAYEGFIQVPAGNHHFKFDTSSQGDWSTNYGDNDLSGRCLDLNGANIPLTQGAGTYRVTFSSGHSQYGCQRPFIDLIKTNSFNANHRSMYLRTSFNGWGSLPMRLVANHLWEAEIKGLPNTFGGMKFDVQANWLTNFGLPYGANPNTYNGPAVANGNNLQLYIEDYSGAAQVSRKIRFNDQNLAYAICPLPGQPVASPALCQ